MKNTFLQSPVIALQHIKNLAWAIEELYSKTCVRKGLLRVFCTTIGLITVFDAILTGRQSGQKLQCLYGNPIANNFFQN